jgi:hypothetical protein
MSDAATLGKLGGVLAVVPVVQGNARVETDNKQRRTNVIGASAAVPQVWKMRPVSGQFLPAGEDTNPRAFAVLGDKLATELFGKISPLGQRIRIGTDRYRVIGVMEKKGQMLGYDMDDTVYIPAAKALEMFDRESLMEIDLLYSNNVSVATGANCPARWGGFYLDYPKSDVRKHGFCPEYLNAGSGGFGRHLLVGWFGWNRHDYDHCRFRTSFRDWLIKGNRRRKKNNFQIIFV